MVGYVLMGSEEVQKKREAWPRGSSLARRGSRVSDELRGSEPLRGRDGPVPSVPPVPGSEPGMSHKVS